MTIVLVLNGKKLQDIEAAVVVNDVADANRFVDRCKPLDVHEQFTFETLHVDMIDDVVELIRNAAE